MMPHTDSIFSFVKQNARSLDQALLKYQAGTGTAEEVCRELAVYQNADGGFGHALEPDVRAPESSVLATTVAFQYLAKIGVLAETGLVRKGVSYFISQYVDETNSWNNLPPTANHHPRAPWWDADSPSSKWGNPAAEVLGYLLQYSTYVEDTSIIDSVSTAAVARIGSIHDPEFHEILCFQRLFQCAGDALRKQLRPHLERAIRAVTEVNPDQWKGYGAVPLTFVDAPDAAFAHLFEPELLETNAAYLLNQLVDGDHWEPNWSWGGDFPEAWAQAQRDWSGKLTVENYRLLESMGLSTPTT